MDIATNTFEMSSRHVEDLVSRSLIGINDDLLARAQALLGTATKKDTVNAALAQVVALNARRQFLDDARRGELSDSIDEGVTGQAWRL